MKAPSPLDLTRDLRAAAHLSTSVEAVNQLLSEALLALGRLIPFDLATIMELEGDELRVRIATGRLDRPEIRQHRLALEAFPSIRNVLETRHARAFLEEDHREGDGDPFDGVLDLPHGHACMVVPLAASDNVIGVVTLDRSECQKYGSEVVELADVFGRLLALAILYGEQSSILGRIRAQLEEQNRLLSERVEGRTDATQRIESSRSPVMVHVARLAKQVAHTDTPVLITGETGSGKEVLANALHAWSSRANRPLVSINCAALPPTLIESELFGHVKGAFSGAVSTRIGRFQAANGGTLFLDEVGEIPIDLQAKLLRVLHDGCFEPVGSDRTVRVDVRILAATNVDLRSAVSERRFREDLYYRLAVFPIQVPPLRARKEDVTSIAQSFLDTLARRTGRGPWHLSEGALRTLESCTWPGNVRELVNALERATILSTGPTLGQSLFESGVNEPTPPTAQGGQSQLPSLREMERAHIVTALERTGGRLYGPGGAADLLGIHANTLYSRMKKLGLGGARDHTR